MTDVNNKLNNKVCWIPVQNLKDDEIGTIATKYGISGYTVYVTSNRPAPGSPYLFGGGSYTIIGMEYGDHQFGYQCAMGSYKSMYRTLAYGNWQRWKTIVTNTDPDELNNRFAIAGRINLNTELGDWVLHITSSENATADLGFPEEIADQHCFGISSVREIGIDRYGFQILISQNNTVAFRWIYGTKSKWIYLNQ